MEPSCWQKISNRSSATETLASSAIERLPKGNGTQSITNATAIVNQNSVKLKIVWSMINFQVKMISPFQAHTDYRNPNGYSFRSIHARTTILLPQPENLRVFIKYALTSSGFQSPAGSTPPRAWQSAPRQRARHAPARAGRFAAPRPRRRAEGRQARRRRRRRRGCR